MPKAKKRLDAFGDRLPAHAIARIGSERLTGPCRTLAFSPDSELIAGANDNLAAIWRTRTGERLCTIKLQKLPRFVTSIDDMCLTRDLLVLAVNGATDARDLLVYGTNGKELWGLQMNATTFPRIALSPDGAILATTSGFRGWLFDAWSGEEKGKIEGLARSVAFSPEGDRLAVQNDKGVVVLDRRSVKPIQELRGEHSEPESKVAFTNDGKRVIVVEAKAGITVYDLGAGSLTARHPWPAGVALSVWWPLADLDIADDAVIVSDESHTIHRFDPMTLEETRDSVFPLALKGSGCRVTQDGKLLAAGTGRNLTLWDVKSGDELLPRPAVDRNLHFIDSRRIAFTDHLSVLWTYDLTEGHVQRTGATSVATALAGAWIASSAVPEGSYGPRFVLTRHGRAPVELEIPNAEHVYASDLSPDGRWVIGSVSKPSQVFVWSSETGRLEKTLKGHYEGTIYQVRASPDSELVASCALDRLVLVYDLKSGSTVRLEGHSKAVFCLAFTPDSELLASAGDDRTVHVWNVRTRGKIAVLEGHLHGVWGLAFSRDGKLLASGDAYRLCLWSCESWKQVAEVKTSARRLAWSPDSRHLATCDGLTGLVWSMSDMGL
jgi:WD40 repeat protein